MMAKADSKYGVGDMVTFKFVTGSKETYTGIILGHRLTKSANITVYEIASLNHGMDKYSIGEKCILKKIS
jgi:hypothetical protein